MDKLYLLHSQSPKIFGEVQKWQNSWENILKIGKVFGSVTIMSDESPVHFELFVHFEKLETSQCTF